MSQTSASQNPIGETTAPLTEPPPQVEEEIKRHILDTASRDAAAPEKVKSEDVKSKPPHPRKTAEHEPSE
ncbi:hypothetical protein ASPZODRAFT_16647 [Penicilliopsis zonata CBS 506.65]|uniref:Uncharacterized protein n=1 Tax=Penicilliopsis zonata CBS 506.65 TaxID=1073090 RepID=A0A1L9SG01_9EURO|nr:hypothetical protein ASPZODRAFT_16647 [Penicilliopsis zonata CBS 506.65]OJJ46053.1 hypothetical protein ASPZODRAFT_16647 [Penicilliopsis zonata CBS 506.65]